MLRGETVVYDILRDGIGWTPILMILAWLFGAGAVISAMVRQVREKKSIAFMVFWLVGWLTLGGLGFGNVVTQHLKCKSWARSGFETVEGPVTAFKPLGRWEKGSERFTVGGVTFMYSGANLGQGGYRKESGGGRGPIRDGLVVNVRHKNGRILRLSILQDEGLLEKPQAATNR